MVDGKLKRISFDKCVSIDIANDKLWVKIRSRKNQYMHSAVNLEKSTQLL